MKKRNIVHSALSLSLTAALCLFMAACGGTQTPADSAAASQPAAPSAAVQPSSAEQASAALPVKALNPKQVEENPYMAKSDANIHHDGYNTDSTDEILPLAIYPEINVSYETTNANASPAIYFDSYGHAVVPLLGGIAIRDLNAEETKTLGYFSPKQHDGGGYVIQSSYTFLDESNRIVCPTSNNHVLMLRATDENGNVLPEFEKVLDIDIKAAAEAALGKELTQNLLSVVFDYDGNLWFATGGFRIYPQRQQQGVIGYIARSAIDAILNGEQTDLSKAVFVHELTPGEGAENGIAASKDGAVVLTNQNCYLLRAEEGVDVVWCTPYESAGAKVSGEGDKTTGGGLAWGGGCSPTLTPNLVLFTDNQDTVNLLALDMKTGEVVASTPVLDDLPEGYQVAVENSAIVYDDGEGTVSTIVCNWFGAGNAGLADPNNDSSIQSYANIYSSEVGVGSTFNVQIPLDIDKDPQARERADEQADSCSLAGMNVLLAEDNELNAEIAQALLESEGIVVTRAADGNEAVDLYVGRPAGSFDAILMDIMMPDMDGYEATRAIRLSEKVDAADIPIIALTANAFAEDAKAAHDAGMNAHLSKPLDFNKLKNMLSRIKTNGSVSL